jgi:hypothetical protein
VRLAHALDLCVHAPAQVRAVPHKHAGCSHDHGEPSPPHQAPGDCPHLEEMPQHPGLIGVAVPVTADLPGPPALPPASCLQAPLAAAFPAETPQRPPTGPPRVGCVLLLI